MVNSKKLLSLFLAVVMLLSTFTVMAFAYTVGPEVSGDINYKYTVEKVDTVPETAAGSAEYTADNIYGVSVWMQCDTAVEAITAPFHFNKALFSPIMLFDGEVTYPYGAGFGVDDYYSNMGEGTVYAYAEGDYLNNTGMYKANGTTATTKALAKCIGLGNSNSEGVTITAELVSPDHPLYNKWGAGLPADTGVMYVNLDVQTKAKTAYLNTISGITQDTGWNKMFTFYFEAIADDVTGAEFGVYTDNCFTVDGCCDANAGYFVSATARKGTNPNKNVVSNAVIEAPAEPTSIVNPMKEQIRFDKNADGSYAGTFDVRAIAKITGADFDATFGSIADAKEMITSVGFVFTQGTANYDDMVAVASGESVEGYTYAPVDFISTSFDPGNYTFSCIVNNASDVNESLSAVGYVEYVDADGVTQYAFYTDVQTVTFKTLYDAHYNDAFAA